MGELSDERIDALRQAAGEDRLSAIFDGAHQIARRTRAQRHDVLIVLGSGAQDALTHWAQPEAVIPLSDLPGVLAPVAPGHSDRLASFSYSNAQMGRDLHILVAYGRTHLYEGHGPEPVVRLAQIAAATGVKTAVLVNANGCLANWQLGDVMTITDHLNFTGMSPFSGTVFVDVRHVWDPDIVALLSTITQRQGIYAALRGPEYQTMAETRWLAASGAHAVGMSTVLEAITLHHLGVAVGGMSVVSDLSFSQNPTDPLEVVRLVEASHATLCRGIEAVIDHCAARMAGL